MGISQIYNMKAGFKTSEFYIAMAGIAGIVWQFVQTHCQTNSTEIIALAVMVITYVTSRTYLKNKTMQ